MSHGFLNLQTQNDIIIQAGAKIVVFGSVSGGAVNTSLRYSIMVYKQHLNRGNRYGSSSIGIFSIRHLHDPGSVLARRPVQAESLRGKNAFPITRSPISRAIESVLPSPHSTRFIFSPTKSLSNLKRHKFLVTTPSPSSISKLGTTYCRRDVVRGKWKAGAGGAGEFTPNDDGRKHHSSSRDLREDVP